jgi:serine/threonine protein kinase
LAPEVLRGEEYSLKVDVYSFGIILYELLTRSSKLYKCQFWFQVLVKQQQQQQQRREG